MCLVVFSYLHEFHGGELESLLLEPLDDLSDQTALDAVWLDHDKSPLVRHVVRGVGRQGVPDTQKVELKKPRERVDHLQKSGRVKRQKEKRNEAARISGCATNAISIYWASRVL